MSQNETTNIGSLVRERAAEAVAQNLGVPPPSRKWKTRVLLPGAIGAATLSIFAFSARGVLLPVTEVDVVPVIAKSDADAPAQAGVIVQAPGWVEADPFPVAVSALADGVVQEMLVLEGDRVEAGQVVARLVNEDAKIALQQAEAKLNAEQARLDSTRSLMKEAEQNWDHPIELKRIHEVAEAQLAERRAELARWPAELASAKATLVTLKAELDRIAPLHERGQASDLEFVRTKQAHEVQQAEVEKVRLRKAILDAQIAAIEADVDAAHHRLELRIEDTRAVAEARAAVKEAEAAVALAQAQRDRAALTLSRMEVRAPTGGVVMTRLAEPGSKLMLNMDNPRSAQAVRLYDPKQLQVRVDVPLTEAAKLGVRQPAEIIVDVLPERVFRGRITRVVHEADVQKNTLQVKVAIEDPIPELKPEMLARARFLAMPSASDEASGDAEALFAPQRAVFGEGESRYVWLADEAGVARRVAVTAGGVVEGGYVRLRDGVHHGDRLIVNPPADLQDGVRIYIAAEAKGAGDGAD